MEKERLLDYEDAIELIQNMLDIVYRIDKDGKFTFVNDAVRQLGYEPEELIGKHFSILIHPNDVKRVSSFEVLPQYEGKMTGDQKAPKLFDEKRTGARSTRNLEVRLVPKRAKIDTTAGLAIGEVRAAGHHYPRVKREDRDETRKYLGTIGIISDITERKHLEEQVQLMQNMNSMAIFTRGIVHDFNNLLTTIKGYSNLLVSENLTEEQREEYLKAIQNASEIAGDVLERLRLYSEGKASDKTNFDLCDITDKVFKLFQEPKYEHIKKIIDFKPGQFYVFSDPNGIEELLLNLAFNALDSILEKGSQEGDYVRITAETYDNKGEIISLPKGEYIHILFEDTGKGMSEEVRKKAFLPFFTTKERATKKGQGLGLAIAYGIVTSNNGYINIDPAKDKGTSFHIYLPKKS